MIQGSHVIDPFERHLRIVAAAGLVALIAAWVGCSPSVSTGGATDGTAGASTNQTEGSGASSPTGTTDPTTTDTPTTTTTDCTPNPSCNDTFPSPGSPCSPDGTCCSYSNTDHAGGETTTYVTCVNGKWQ